MSGLYFWLFNFLKNTFLPILMLEKPFEFFRPDSKIWEKPPHSITSHYISIAYLAESHILPDDGTLRGNPIDRGPWRIQAHFRTTEPRSLFTRCGVSRLSKRIQNRGGGGMKAPFATKNATSHLRSPQIYLHMKFYTACVNCWGVKLVW